GFLVLRWLTDRPAKAHWLNTDERVWLANRMSREDSGREQRHLGEAMRHPRVWLLCALYFTVAVGSNGMGFYLPKILNERFERPGELKLGILSAIPSLLAVVAMIVVSRHSDRTGERRWHVAGSAFLAAIGWTLGAAAQSPWLLLAGMCLASIGMMCMIPCY